MKPTLEQLRALVGNPDVYAVQTQEGYRPVREPLTNAVLREHLAERITVGTYIGHPVGDDTVARTLVFDFDTGYDSDDIDRVCAALGEVGFPNTCWGVEDSGRKGYHIWLVLQQYIPNADLRRMGRAVCALAGWQGEVFPKQDQVQNLGNLVKLPGSVHLATGRQNNFLGPAPNALSLGFWKKLYATLPEEQHARRPASDLRFPCMAHILDEGVVEGGRNDQLFHLATMLRRGGVTDSYVDLVVNTVNDRMEDPLDQLEVDNLIQSSRNSGPLCSRIPEERHCGELCVLERTSGLYTRPGALRFAAAGERVVLEVVKHEDSKSVTLSHDDALAAKASLRPMGK